MQDRRSYSHVTAGETKAKPLVQDQAVSQQVRIRARLCPPVLHLSKSAFVPEMQPFTARFAAHEADVPVTRSFADGGSGGARGYNTLVEKGDKNPCALFRAEPGRASEWGCVSLLMCTHISNLAGVHPGVCISAHMHVSVPVHALHVSRHVCMRALCTTGCRDRHKRKSHSTPSTGGIR